MAGGDPSILAQTEIPVVPAGGTAQAVLNVSLPAGGTYTFGSTLLSALNYTNRGNNFLTVGINAQAPTVDLQATSLTWDYHTNRVIGQFYNYGTNAVTTTVAFYVGDYRSASRQEVARFPASLPSYVYPPTVLQDSIFPYAVQPRGHPLDVRGSRAPHRRHRLQQQLHRGLFSRSIQSNR